MTTKEKKPVQLVVDTDSWHFKHFCRIRRFYGIDTKSDMTTSLCPYVQTMIWGTVVFALTLPLQILGWLLLKGARWSYKMSEVMGCTKFVDFIDRMPVAADAKLGEFMERAEDNLYLRPFITLMQWAIIAVGCLTFIAAIALIVIFGVVSVGHLIWLLILAIPHIPWAIYMGACYCGWALVWIAWAIVAAIAFVALKVWWLLCVIFASMAWFFTAGWLWLLFLKVIAYTAIGVVASVVIGWLVLQIGSSSIFKRLLGFLTMKFNGYKEARTKAAERRKIALAKRLEEEAEAEVEVEPTQPYRPGLFKRFRYKMCEVLDDVCIGIGDFFISFRVDVGKRTAKIMSPCAMIWACIVAIKKRACPLVTFVDVEEMMEQEAEIRRQEEVEEQQKKEEEEKKEEPSVDTSEGDMQPDVSDDNEDEQQTE